jgi:hypothetical protein
LSHPVNLPKSIFRKFYAGGFDFKKQSLPLRSVFGKNKFYRVSDETYIPTLAEKAQQQARFPYAHGVQRWTQNIGPPS